MTITVPDFIKRMTTVEWCIVVAIVGLLLALSAGSCQTIRETAALPLREQALYQAWKAEHPGSTLRPSQWSLLYREGLLPNDKDGRPVSTREDRHDR